MTMPSQEPGIVTRPPASLIEAGTFGGRKPRSAAMNLATTKWIDNVLAIRSSRHYEQ